MFLSDVSIKRPVFATMMMVALVVLGIATQISSERYFHRCAPTRQE